MRITRTAATAALTGLLATALAACGSSGSSGGSGTAAKPSGAGSPAAGAPAGALPGGGAKAELLAAAAVMAKAGSAKITSTGNGGGKPGTDAVGHYAWGGQPKLDLRRQSNGTALAVRAVGGQVYLGTTAQPSPLPGGKHWVELTGTESGTFQSMLVMLDPVAQLTAAAQSGKVTDAGTDAAVGGAHHYQGTVPADTLLAGLSNLTADQRSALQAQLAGGSVKLDFWLNAKRELVQEHQSELNSAGAPTGTGDVSTVYADLGSAVDVAAPAASDLADQSAALQLLGLAQG
ncbi:hypothetical protein ACFYNO_03840 [Kitasatospora sp. NPDC006697]|uniref:hypothetical protein n=1 Tax=Kitasatospora sp. NPDC006697 TaxID=3364020 RepID=UPI00368D36C9